MNLADETLKRLRDNSDFKEFQSYIALTIDNLDSISGITGSNEKIGEIVRAKQEAKEILYAILQPILEVKPNKKVDREALEKIHTKYGLDYDPRTQ